MLRMFWEWVSGEWDTIIQPWGVIGSGHSGSKKFSCWLYEIRNSLRDRRVGNSLFPHRFRLKQKFNKFAAAE